MTRFQNQFEIKKTARDQILFIFFESIQHSKNVRFKKRTNRRKRDLIEKEMTNANEIVARRQRHAATKDLKNKQTHKDILEKEANEKVQKKRKKTQLSKENFFVEFSQIDDFFSKEERSENSLFIFDDEINIRDTLSQTQFEITSFAENQMRIHEFSFNFSSENLLFETTSQTSLVVKFNFSASKFF